MTLDIERMKEMALDLYIPEAIRAFGDDGKDALRDMLSTLIQLYRVIDPSILRHSIILYFPIEQGVNCQDTIPPQSSKLLSPEYITTELDSPCVIKLSGDGSLVIHPPVENLSPVELSKNSLVYVFEFDNEYFIIKGAKFRIKNPAQIMHASVFARPVYRSLKKALEDYKIKRARHNTCHILKGMWHDPNCLFLKNKPEQIMRRSLSQYLDSVLQNAEVRPEQNVDESHPVDIKVTWMLSNNRAIIEIKWLGKSIGPLNTVTSDYSESRALAGARQLAEYIDSSCEFGPTVSTRGYLVVFDARRKGLSIGASQISRQNGMHYQDKNVTYSPAYHISRRDFEEPIRIFMAPVCQDV